ncbi:hypothetical protein TRFO_38049 [Tritrichomonas foetus]|uniref:Nucleotide-diphospho-sugar transferase domain-containing protein n=1 Tax=Tritrichomonas foetus TaxID=1144522 RepID=A0A1J4JDQ2_9EUKA|nr:hypothetical protein TRFO_38049 [Tritrichomonas foetus]|eukprot:OHS95803.1 hypothetical protein TRFO_38049 [Tritrichomonas foetus]
MKEINISNLHSQPDSLNIKGKENTYDDIIKKIYISLSLIWISFVIGFLCSFTFKKETNNNNNNSIVVTPIYDQYNIVISVLTWRFSWHHNLFYMKQMTNQSLDPKSKINTILYSDSLNALSSILNGVHTPQCPGGYVKQNVIGCRFDLIFSHFLELDYAPWLFIATDDFYFNEKQLLKFIEVFETKYNPMNENIFIGKFENKYLHGKSGYIFSRKLVNYLLENKFKLNVIADENLRVETLIYDFIKKNNEKIHVFNNHFSVFGFPVDGTWNFIGNKSWTSLPKCQETQRIPVNNIVSLFMEPFENETVELAKYIPEIPEVVKYIPNDKTPTICYDRDNHLDQKFSEKFILSDKYQFDD